ncbi:MAG: ABC transporter permease [Armatimonadota bacterium]|nr:ABC transporter permease [Armatimonadota bacterium]
MASASSPATSAAGTVDETRSAGRSHWAIGFARLRRNTGAVAGACVVLCFVLASALAPWITDDDPVQVQFEQRFAAPSWRHPLGTDSFGRDLLSRVLYGGGLSLSVGLIAIAISDVIGIPLGLVSGYRGGRFDNVVMRIVDLWLAFPGLLLAIAIVAILGPGLQNVMIAIGIGGVPGLVRLVRGQVLSVRALEFVDAARVTGGGDAHIIRTHVFPNVLAPIVVLTTLRLAGAILSGVGLSFLGLGAQPPAPEWGAIVAEGRSYLREAWWVSTLPGVAIFLTVMGFNLLGDGLRDAFDPRLR